MSKQTLYKRPDRSEDIKKLDRDLRLENLYPRSHANRRFRIWLERVMGSDHIQMSDRKWHELFRQKVMDDYEHQMNERERQLEEAEVQRIQKLRLQGILHDEEERDKIRNKKTRTKKKTPGSHDSWLSKHQDLYTRPNEDIVTQIQILSNEKNHKQNDSIDNERLQDSTASAIKEDEISSLGNSDQRHMSENTKMSSSRRGTGSKTSSNCDEQDALDNDDKDSDDDTQRSSYKRHLGITSYTIRPDALPAVKQLYDEENLHQLYAQAEGLIRQTDTVTKQCLNNSSTNTAHI